MSKVSSPQFDLPDAMAIKAVAAGTADEHQQRRAITHILQRLCEMGRLAYVPESDRDTCLALGRQSVGFEIRLYVQETVDELKRISEQRSASRSTRGSQ